MSSFTVKPLPDGGFVVFKDRASDYGIHEALYATNDLDDALAFIRRQLSSPTPSNHSRSGE